MVESLDILTTYRCPHCDYRTKGTDPKDAEFRPRSDRTETLECPNCGAGVDHRAR
ncbi:hypothetical protein ACFQJ7_13905 [Halovenus rubra]|uniref:Small CPxCG-related zinc finger protein n=2 Tax=Halovenus rubra TaxID=869890 RepID=A0ABD5X981_9EURY|nr:hypothetical protein [Halovenus rubra]